ncbi:hypothetical protein [Corynebacterium halotolerans]|uniref:hypothetical protein n=1 Tax=Corynebacterium halotolerans TaxID=225326 RepID=UPI003CE7222E
MAAPTATAQPSWEQSMENPAQTSYELSVQSPVGVALLIAAMSVHYFVICPVMLTTGSWENDGRCTF